MLGGLPAPLIIIPTKSQHLLVSCISFLDVTSHGTCSFPPDLHLSYGRESTCLPHRQKLHANLPLTESPTRNWGAINSFTSSSSESPLDEGISALSVLRVLEMGMFCSCSVTFSPDPAAYWHTAKEKWISQDAILTSQPKPVERCLPENYIRQLLHMCFYSGVSHSRSSSQLL